ncbi:MAG: DUF2752 domain-containing protein [Clostridiaceae bacterium]|nr:DUF2752 domain-containing protein [Clostridiaceae bacterium]
MLKSKHLGRNDYILHISLLLLCLIPLLVSFMLTINGSYTTIRIGDSVHRFGFPCIFKLSTGYNCPVCGMTRSYIFMSKLDIMSAWRMNKAGVLLYIFCVFQIPYRLLLIAGTKIDNKYIMVFETVFLIIIGIVVLFEFVRQFIPSSSPFSL